jgi:hypothetical protein
VGEGGEAARIYDFGFMNYDLLTQEGFRNYDVGIMIWLTHETF